MSAIRQIRVREPEAVSTAETGTPIAPSAADRENPIELLRDAIAKLNASGGDLPDQSQVATLLAEARDALDRANVIAGAIAQCQGYLREAKFDQAFEALDAGLVVYPGDPSLVTRRGEVGAQQDAWRAAAAVRTALEEADWFVAQDRIDLAAQHLKEKAREVPDQPALISRLKELESQLSAWKQKRDVQAALGRAAALQQLQQWQAALTILEEQLEVYPTSEELTGAAKQVQEQLVYHERQKKLGRRLELIGQKMAAESWRQALTLLENTQREFPGAAELEPLRGEIDAGLRRSECDAIVAEVRQCLADGELDQAEQLLRGARKTLGPEPALEVLCDEVVSERKYRQDLREAQILFGKRLFRHAESILTEMTEDRPEAQALLAAVREARTATEEESFLEGGRETALELIQQGQFAQAEDMLRNLLSLFPGNPLLERDLKAARNGLSQRPSEGARVAEQRDTETELQELAKSFRPEKQSVHAGAPAVEAVRESSPSRWRRTAVVGAASLVLVSAAGAGWKLSRNATPDSTPAATQPAKKLPAETQLPAAPQGASTPVATPAPEPPHSSLPAPQSTGTNRAAASEGKVEATVARATPLRQFAAPNTNQDPRQVQSQAMPLPPAAEPIITAETAPALPASLLKSREVIPAPAASPQPAAPAPVPAAPPGGRLEQAVLVTRVLPSHPELARRAGRFGTVRLEAVVDERGAVKDVKVVAGDPVLAAVAKDAVLKWKYKPATLNSKPIATSVLIQIVFGNPNK